MDLPVSEELSIDAKDSYITTHTMNEIYLVFKDMVYTKMNKQVYSDILVC